MINKNSKTNVIVSKDTRLPSRMKDYTWFICNNWECINGYKFIEIPNWYEKTICINVL